MSKNNPIDWGEFERLLNEAYLQPDNYYMMRAISELKQEIDNLKKVVLELHSLKGYTIKK